MTEQPKIRSRCKPASPFLISVLATKQADTYLRDCKYNKIKSWKQAHAIQRGLIKRYKAYLQANRKLEGTDWLDLLLEIKPGNYYRYEKKVVKMTTGDFGGRKTTKVKRATILHIARVI